MCIRDRLQPEVAVLAERLIAAGYTVLAETSGERAIDLLPREVVKIMDVKCPDSGEFGTFRAANLDALGPKDEVKFVIASRRDYEFARDFTRQHDLDHRVRQVLLSPVHADPAGTWPGLDAREPVSYTHLDVYKRQPLCSNLLCGKILRRSTGAWSNR